MIQNLACAKQRRITKLAVGDLFLFAFQVGERKGYSAPLQVHKKPSRGPIEFSDGKGGVWKAHRESWVYKVKIVAEVEA